MLSEPRRDNRDDRYPIQDERYNEVEPAKSTFNSLMAKITGRAIPNDNRIPNRDDYNGPRPDLHVSRIYDEAPRYRQREDVYNPSGRPSRLSDNDVYVPASERNVSRGGSLYNRNSRDSRRDDRYESRYSSREPEYRSRFR